MQNHVQKKDINHSQSGFTQMLVHIVYSWNRYVMKRVKLYMTMEIAILILPADVTTDVVMSSWLTQTIHASVNHYKKIVLATWRPAQILIIYSQQVRLSFKHRNERYNVHILDSCLFACLQIKRVVQY